MTTASNAIKSCIEDNWNAGTGGTEPTVYTGAEDGMYPSTAEWVFLQTWEYSKRRKRRNDSFVKEDDYVSLRVYTRNHANKEERLDEMVNEIYRIVTPTNVTGYHKVDIIEQHRRASDKRQNMYVADLTVELKILSTSSTATPGSTTTSEIEVDELTVNTSIAGNPTAALGDTTVAGSVLINDTGAGPFLSTGTTTDTTDPMALLRFKIEREWMFRKRSTGASTRLTLESDTDGKYFWIGYDDGVIYCAKFGVHDVQEDCTVQLGHNVTIDNNLTVGGTVTGATSAQIDDLLMFGSANAAPVPCILISQDSAHQFKSLWNLENEGVHDPTFWFLLPLPTTKGGLKLYVAQLDLYVIDADATDYIDTLRVYGHKHSDGAITSLDEDPTDYDSAQPVTWNMTDIDLSAYSQCLVRVTTICDTDAALNFSHPNLRVYYAA